MMRGLDFWAKYGGVGLVLVAVFSAPPAGVAQVLQTICPTTFLYEYSSAFFLELLTSFAEVAWAALKRKEIN
jgi:hypothetical protein